MIDHTSGAIVVARAERVDFLKMLRDARHVQLDLMTHHSRKIDEAATPALRALHRQKYDERRYAAGVLDDLIDDMKGRSR